MLRFATIGSRRQWPVFCYKHRMCVGFWCSVRWIVCSDDTTKCCCNCVWKYCRIGCWAVRRTCTVLGVACNLDGNVQSELWSLSECFICCWHVINVNEWCSSHNNTSHTPHSFLYNQPSSWWLLQIGPRPRKVSFGANSIVRQFFCRPDACASCHQNRSVKLWFHGKII